MIPENVDMPSDSVLLGKGVPAPLWRSTLPENPLHARRRAVHILPRAEGMHYPLSRTTVPVPYHMPVTCLGVVYVLVNSQNTLCEWGSLSSSPRLRNRFSDVNCAQGGPQN